MSSSERVHRALELLFILCHAMLLSHFLMIAARLQVQSFDFTSAECTLGEYSLW